jgi:hypothetical protein
MLFATVLRFLMKIQALAVSFEVSELYQARFLEFFSLSAEEVFVGYLATL